MRLLTLLSVLSILGCGYSPLLNHTIADARASLTESRDGVCQFSFAASHLCASLEWTKLPENDLNGEGEAVISFWDMTEATSPAPTFIDPGHSVHVKLWMPGMGHGSTRVSVNSSATGQFNASPLHFVMGGDWEIWIQLKDGNVVIDQAKIDISVAH